VGTFDELRRVLAKETGRPESEIRPETPLREFVGDLSAPDDSLDLVEFTLLLEELPAFEVADWDADRVVEDLEQLVREGTLQDLADYIDRRRS
jgi:hypothetical protein